MATRMIMIVIYYYYEESMYANLLQQEKDNVLDEVTILKEKVTGRPVPPFELMNQKETST